MEDFEYANYLSMPKPNWNSKTKFVEREASARTLDCSLVERRCFWLRQGSTIL